MRPPSTDGAILQVLNGTRLRCATSKLHAATSVSLPSFCSVTRCCAACTKPPSEKSHLGFGFGLGLGLGSGLGLGLGLGFGFGFGVGVGLEGLGIGDRKGVRVGVGVEG